MTSCDDVDDVTSFLAPDVMEINASVLCLKNQVLPGKQDPRVKLSVNLCLLIKDEKLEVDDGQRRRRPATATMTFVEERWETKQEKCVSR